MNVKTQCVKEQAFSLWREGLDNRRTARKLGKSESWVSSLFRQHGLTPNVARKPSDYTPEEDQYIIAQREAGKGWLEIARNIGRHPGSVAGHYRIIFARLNKTLIKGFRGGGLQDGEIRERIGPDYSRCFLYREPITTGSQLRRSTAKEIAAMAIERFPEHADIAREWLDSGIW